MGSPVLFSHGEKMGTASDLPAVLFLSLILTTFFTGVISAALLVLYRRAALRWMNRQAPAPASPASIEDDSTPLTTNVSPPEFILLNKQAPSPGSRAEAFYNRLKVIAKKHVRIYTFAGMGYALTMSLSTFIFNPIKLLPFTFLIAFWIYLFPVLFSLHLIIHYDKKLSRWIPLGYFLIYFALIFLGAVPRWGDMLNALTSFIWINTFPLLLSLIFLNRRTKAVAPLIMSLVFFVITGIILALAYGLVPLSETILYSNHWLAITLITLSHKIHPAALAPITLILLALSGISLVGVFGFFLLRWLGRAYEQKKISDQSLLIDALWLNFALVHALLLNPSKPRLIFLGLIAFLVYKLIAVIGFALSKEKTTTEEIPQLLFLRVFSLGKRSQALYQAMTAFWRLGGNPIFITGPDLLTSTVEPHDFLDFLGNKLQKRFTDSEKTLNQQIDRIDTTPDHDGNYRIQDFFCYDNTWKMALSRLTKESEVILMDLRSFSKKNAGCKFEIEELINHIPTGQVIFVIDKTTDDSFMRQTMTSAWENMPSDSPNRISSEKINLFEYTGKRTNEIQELLHIISAVANPS